MLLFAAKPTLSVPQGGLIANLIFLPLFFSCASYSYSSSNDRMILIGASSGRGLDHTLFGRLSDSGRPAGCWRRGYWN